jgi:hypothetical protein
MKYKILDIMPGQIRVEYEDNSWALVPIPPNASLEDIDDAVSQYDPDFLLKPESVINPDIYVGEERTSAKKVVVEPTSTTPNVGITTASPLTSPLPSISFGQNSPINVIVIAEYYSSKGDTRVKDALFQNVEKYISKTEFDVDNLISDLSYDPDDIFAQAEAELNAEQQ